MQKKVIKAIAKEAFEETYNMELNRCEYQGLTGWLAVAKYASDEYPINVSGSWITLKWFIDKIYKQAAKNGCISSF